MAVNRVSQVLNALTCQRWCSPTQGFHVEDCPLTPGADAASILAVSARNAREVEQAAYRRRVDAFGLPALLAPYTPRP